MDGACARNFFPCAAIPADARRGLLGMGEDAGLEARRHPSFVRASIGRTATATISTSGDRSGVAESATLRASSHGDDAGRTSCHITAGQRRAQQAGAPTGKLLNRRRLARPRERRERPTPRKPRATADATARKSRRPPDTNRRDAQTAKGSRYETFAAIAEIRRRIHWTSRKSRSLAASRARTHRPSFVRAGGNGKSARDFAPFLCQGKRDDSASFFPQPVKAAMRRGPFRGPALRSSE